MLTDALLVVCTDLMLLHTPCVLLHTHPCQHNRRLLLVQLDSPTHQSTTCCWLWCRALHSLREA